MIPCRLFRAGDVEGEDQFLVTEEEGAIGDDGVGPDRAAATIDLCRGGEFELADLFEFGFVRFDQHHGGIFVVVAIEPTVGEGDRAAAVGADPFFPQRFA